MPLDLTGISPLPGIAFGPPPETDSKWGGCAFSYPLRTEDFGTVCEHVVLESLQARLPERPPFYWRDKSGRVIDFVIPRDRGSMDAIECKWNPDAFEPKPLQVFRSIYANGRNFLVCPGGMPAHQRSIKGLEISVIAPTEIPQ